MSSRPILIGIIGGTGSGKSTVARAIFESLPEKNIAIIQQDSYYKDQSHLEFEERLKTNYDHPLAFDTDLLIEHVHQLLDRNPIEKPVYDYALHTRSSKSIIIEPQDVIIIEGILVLEDIRLRKLMDIKLFVDTDSDLRIIRRILRDINERDRSINSVVEQYLSVVRPMHNQFIEPNQRLYMFLCLHLVFQ